MSNTSNCNGDYCTYWYQNRTLLGRIEREVEREGLKLFVVRFLNGDLWPIMPSVYAVEILEPDWPEWLEAQKLDKQQR